MMKSWLMTAAFVSCLPGTAFAQNSAPGTPIPQPLVAPSSGVTTSRGPGLVSGAPGSPQSVLIPGSPVPGLLLNNGNGTSSVMIPGQPSQLVPTSR
jgi:hypothetical protein